MDLTPGTLVLFDAEDTPRVRRWAHHPDMQKTRDPAARRAVAQSLQRVHQSERNLARMERFLATAEQRLSPLERRIRHLLFRFFDFTESLKAKLNTRSGPAPAPARPSRR